MLDTSSAQEKIEVLKESHKGFNPCPDCSSSDACMVYDDHSHCYSCGAHYYFTGNKVKTKPAVPDGMLWGETIALKARDLTEATCKKWGTTYVITRQGDKAIAFGYYKDGKRVAQKVRTADKKFTILGEPKAMQLYGQHLWNEGKHIVITEGEIDAMTVGQVQDHRYPVVSLPNGAQAAKKAVTSQLKWLLENFEDIILMFDMDEPGQKAAQEVAALFPPGRCKIASLPYKDANECLTKGEGKAITKAIWDAKEYRPDGVVEVADLLDKLDEMETVGDPLPWEELTEITGGMKPEEVWVWAAGSGVGKTTFFKEMVANLIQTQGKKVGVIFLEETAPTTIKGICSIIAEKNFNLPENKKLLKDTAKELSSRQQLYLYNHFGHISLESLEGVIRHMIAAYGCDYIFFDHITALLDGEGGEANQMAEKAMKTFAQMTRELSFNLQMISHLRKTESSRKAAEEGGHIKLDDIKGSGAIKQWASNVVTLERNQNLDKTDLQGVTRVYLRKARNMGKNVGQYATVFYDEDTNRLTGAEGGGF